MEKVTLREIYSQGVIYRKYDPDSIVHHRLDEIEFKASDPGDSRYGIHDLHYFIKDWYMSLWKTVGLNIHNCTFRVRELRKGDWLDIHSPMMESQYKALIPCPRGSYEGAEFIWSGPDGKPEWKKVEFGDIFFIRTGSEKYGYGFKKLKSDEPLRYIEIYGALNFSKKIEDQFYEEIDINKIKLK